MPPISMTLKDASAACGLGQTKLYELIGQGKLDARKAGRRTLIMSASLKRYIESLPSAKP